MKTGSKSRIYSHKKEKRLAKSISNFHITDSNKVIQRVSTHFQGQKFHPDGTHSVTIIKT